MLEGVYHSILATTGEGNEGASSKWWAPIALQTAFKLSYFVLVFFGVYRNWGSWILKRRLNLGWCKLCIWSFVLSAALHCGGVLFYGSSVSFIGNYLGCFRLYSAHHLFPSELSMDGWQRIFSNMLDSKVGLGWIFRETPTMYRFRNSSSYSCLHSWWYC